MWNRKYHLKNDPNHSWKVQQSVFLISESRFQRSLLTSLGDLSYLLLDIFFGSKIRQKIVMGFYILNMEKDAIKTASSYNYEESLKRDRWECRTSARSYFCKSGWSRTHWWPNAHILEKEYSAFEMM